MRKTPDNQKGVFPFIFQAGNIIHNFRPKPSKKAEKEPAAAETVPQLIARVKEILQGEELEKEEENTQREYEKEAKLAANKDCRQAAGRKPKDNIKSMFPANTVSF